MGANTQTTRQILALVSPGRCSPATGGWGNAPRSVPTNAEVITSGVNTHKDIHVALYGLGRRLGAPSAPSGLQRARRLANGFGPPERAGVEVTGCFGAVTTRFLRAEGIAVLR